MINFSQDRFFSDSLKFEREGFQIFTNWVPYFGALEPYIEYSIICSYFGQCKHIRNTYLLVYWLCLSLTCVKKVSNTDDRRLLWNSCIKTAATLRKARSDNLTTFNCLKIGLEGSWNFEKVTTFIILFCKMNKGRVAEE